MRPKEDLKQFKKIKYIDKNLVNPGVRSNIYLTNIHFEKDLDYIKANFKQN